MRNTVIMNQETKQFIFDNADVNVHLLALKSARFPKVDMSLAIRQLNGKQKIKSKVPLFYQTEEILYPSQLSLEQSSSESTARYKSILCEGNTLADLTGGFGVDCCFLSDHFQSVIYVERQEELCELARHNFEVLGKENIQVIQSETEKYLSTMEKVDWIFIDPARRNTSGRKVVLLSDCEPDVSALSSLLLEKAKRVMIKLSPMMDITAAILELPNTLEIHIISVNNDCKEVLLILDQTIRPDKRVKTINITKTNKFQAFEYEMMEESKSDVSFTTVIKKYLYEPNASIMKSGAFKLIGSHFNLSKLHVNTHLYTSNELNIQFPGRIFEVVKTWTKSEMKELTKHLTKANITARNYPMSVDELRNKLKIKEGGDVYLFACTLIEEQKVLIETRKITKTSSFKEA